MGYIKGEDIKGYHFDCGYVCFDCATDKDLSNLMEDEILTENDMKEEDYYFCDRCSKQLWKRL